MSLLHRLLWRKPVLAATTVALNAGHDAASYPTVDPGIDAASVAEMLAAEDKLLARFKYCYGSASFEPDILEPIRAYARYVNLLPATADNFFCGAGGLFRLGLEVAFHALQGTDGHIVSGRSTISVRKELEPRWRQATFLAGLCSELHRTLSQITVTDAQGNEWPAYLMPLSTWLEQRKARRFYVRWISNAPESRGPGLFALPHIVPASTMQHLASGNHTVVPQMLACISGIPLLHEQSILIELVRRAAALVIDRDLVASAHRYGKPILGAHIERYLLDAMRHLVATNAAWSPNSERSRVWLGADGLFIVWPNAATEIRKVLEEDQLRGIPKSPETIAEILTAAGVFLAPPGQQDSWLIQPPGASSPIEAVRLSSAEILLAGQLRATPPLPQALAVRADAKPQSSTRQAPAPTARPSPAQTARDHDELLQASLELAPPPRSGAEPAAPPLAAAADHTDLAVDESEPALAAPAPVHFSLRAPMRLVPQVRQALAAAIDTLNGDADKASAVTTASGVFVPFEHFRGHSLDANTVLRALADANMLVGTSEGRTRAYRHEVHGQEQPGVVVRPEHVQGLDPDDFRPSP